jgi:hypothetical protein
MVCALVTAVAALAATVIGEPPLPDGAAADARSAEPRLHVTEVRAGLLIGVTRGPVRARLVDLTRAWGVVVLGWGALVPGRLRVDDRDLLWSPRDGWRSSGAQEVLVAWNDVTRVETTRTWLRRSIVRIVTEQGDDVWLLIRPRAAQPASVRRMFEK